MCLICFVRPSRGEVVWAACVRVSHSMDLSLQKKGPLLAMCQGGQSVDKGSLKEATLCLSKAKCCEQS